MSKSGLPPVRPADMLALRQRLSTISFREYKALTFAGRLELVRAAGGRRKYELLVEAPDSERLVRHLPAEEVFLLIRELGLADVPELVIATDTAQFTAFLDLDCWRTDLFDSRSALEWLLVLFDGGEEKLLQTAQELDFPLLVLLLKKEMTVLATPGEFEDEESRFQVGQQNAGYEVEYRDAEIGKLLAAFLQVLQRHDSELFVRLMEAVRWEQEAVLEEEIYQERRVRLESLGFPDPFEARAIYAWTDPAVFDPNACRRVAADLPAGSAPTFMLTAASPGGLLAAVLAGGIDDATAWDLTWLLNRVMLAQHVDVGDVAQVREASGEVFRYLNLALEHLCGTDVGRAGDLFAGCYLQSFFRLGFSLTIELQRRAQQLEKSSAAPWFDPPFRAFLDALGRKKPLFFEGVADPARGGARPFATLRELHLAGEWLDRLGAQVRLFSTRLPFALPNPADADLSGCWPAAAADVTLSTFYLTALANRLLGRDFLPQPIPAGELPALRTLLLQPGRLEALRRETVEGLEGTEPGSGAFAEFSLHRWEEELLAAPVEAIDLRYLSSLIIRAAG